jgi:hypothetical protein
MAEYKPSMIVAKLAEKLRGKPIAEAIRIDGTVVIVFEDGRKLTFDKDAITRTLTEPEIITPEFKEYDPPLEDAGLVSEMPSRRKKKGTHE